MEMEADPNPDSRPVLEAGAMLGSYRIESLIGRGGMGEVYLARDERLQRPVAIKRIRFDRALDGHQQERFHREALAVAQLSHPAIVQVHEWLDTPFGNCLVMEWIQGRNLSKVIAMGDLDLRRILQLACQIADGLTEAHGKGFLHRDLKPENVLVTNSGHAKIVDFGLAVPLERFADDAETALTKSGAVVGTVYTMSPEQARGRKLDLRSDLFSFGCILYEMLAGRSPFRAKTWFDTVHNIVTAEPQPLRSDLPPQLVELVFRLLAKDPAHRPANAAEVHRILEACLLGPGDLGRDALAAPREGDGSGASSIPTAFQVMPEKVSSAERGDEVAPTPVSGTGSEITLSSGGRRRLGWGGRSIAAIGVLLLLSLVAARSGIWKKEAELGARSRYPQILVLPFKDETGENLQGSATGATDEMARLLGQIEGIDVMAGLAAEPYSKKEFSALREELEGRIDYVLTGKVYRSGSVGGEGALQVSAQLARLQDGSQVWSGSFGTNLDGGQLLGGAGGGVSHEIETTLGLTSPVARAENAYRRALEYRREPGYSKENLVKAVELLKLAVREDPEMVTAWAELAIVQSLLHFNGDFSENWAAGASTTLATATRLKPQAPEVRLAAAFVEYRIHQQFKDAKAIFEEFVADYPNDAEGLTGLGYAERRLGLLAEACLHFEAAYRLQPSVDLSAALAETYRAQRRWQEAHRYFQETADLEPQNPLVHSEMALNLFDWKGSAKDARNSLASFVHDRSPSLLHYWLRLDLYTGSYHEALDRYSRWPMPTEIEQAQNTWLVARAAHLLGSRDRARLLVVGNRSYLLERTATNRANSWDYAYLALAHAYLGEADQARQVMAKAIDSAPKDDFTSPRFLEFQAEMEVLLGSEDRAMKILRVLLNKEYQHPLSRARLRFDPAWAPLRSNSEFAGLAEMN